MRARLASAVVRVPTIPVARWVASERAVPAAGGDLVHGRVGVDQRRPHPGQRRVGPDVGRLVRPAVGNRRRPLPEPSPDQAPRDPLDPGVGVAGQAGDGGRDLGDDAVGLVGRQRRPRGQDQHLGGPARVGSHDELGAVEQERAGQRRAAGGELDRAGELGRASPHGRLGRGGPHLVQQDLRLLLAPGLPEVLGRADQPPGPRRRLQGERGGPLQRGRGRGRATRGGRPGRPTSPAPRRPPRPGRPRPRPDARPAGRRGTRRPAP